jgi:hypothetical protein
VEEDKSKWITLPVTDLGGTEIEKVTICMACLMSLTTGSECAEHFGKDEDG